MPDESREVATTPEGSPEAKLFANLAVQNRTIEGMESVRAADLGLRPRQLRIIHKIDDQGEADRRGLKPGWFQLGTEPCVQSLEAVFLKAEIGRVLMEGEGPSARATCGSANCRVPFEFLSHPKSLECPSCDFSQWETDPQTGKRVPPPCQKSAVFLGLEGLHTQAGPKPFWFICRRTAFTPAQQFLAELQQDPTVGSLRELTIRLTTEKKKPAGVAYYVPVFAVAKHDPAERQRLRKIFDLARDVVYTHGLREETDEEAPEAVPPARVIEPEVESGNGGIPF